MNLDGTSQVVGPILFCSKMLVTGLSSSTVVLGSCLRKSHQTAQKLPRSGGEMRLEAKLVQRIIVSFGFTLVEENDAHQAK